MPISCSVWGLLMESLSSSCNLRRMINRSKVYLREVARSLKLVKQIVNPREWITILDGQLVALSIFSVSIGSTTFGLVKSNFHSSRELSISSWVPPTVGVMVVRDCDVAPSSWCLKRFGSD
ncbi:hypothetical protein Tco_0845126 [Tanacetum coccineum]